MSTCPHCGERLPSVSDAFCPECFSSLDEPSARERAALGIDDADDHGPNLRDLWSVLVGVCALFGAVLCAARGNWSEALGALLSTVVCFALGAWRLNRGRKPGRRQPSGAEPRAGDEADLP